MVHYRRRSYSASTVLGYFRAVVCRQRRYSKEMERVVSDGLKRQDAKRLLAIERYLDKEEW